MGIKSKTITKKNISGEIYVNDSYLDYQKKLSVLKKALVDHNYINQLLVIVNEYYLKKCSTTRGFTLQMDYHNPHVYDFANSAVLCLLKIFTDSSVFSDSVSVTNDLKILITRMLNNGTEGSHNLILKSRNVSKESARICPFVNVKEKTHNGKQILYIDLNDLNKDSSLLTELSNYDLIPFYKFILNHFGNDNRNEIIYNVYINVMDKSRDIVLKFMDNFKKRPCQMEAKYGNSGLISFFKNNLLDLYLEIILGMEKLCNNFVTNLSFNISKLFFREEDNENPVIEPIFELPIEDDGMFLDGNRNGNGNEDEDGNGMRRERIYDDFLINGDNKHVKQKENLICFLKITKHILNLLENKKITNTVRNNDCNILMEAYIYNLFHNYVTPHDMLNLCNENDSYKKIIIKLGKCITSLMSEKYCRSINQKTGNDNLFYIICYWDSKFDQFSLNRSLMFEEFSYELKNIGYELTKNDSKLIPNDYPENSFFRKILNKITAYCKKDTVTIYEVEYYYVLPQDMLQINVQMGNPFKIKYILKRYTPTIDDFKYYLNNCLVRYNVETLQRYLNFKFMVTNIMIVEYLNNLSCRSHVFSELTNKFDFDFSFAKRSTFLLVLLESLSEELDKELLKSKLSQIVSNFILCEELVKRLDLNLDELYYGCYLNTCILSNIKFFSTFDAINPSYKMRELAAQGNLNAFKKYITNNKLNPDNYCYELGIMSGNKSFVKYLKETFMPTPNSIKFHPKLKVLEVKQLISMVAKSTQTQSYMESACVSLL